MARADIILDSNIVVDILLQKPVALEWADTVRHLRAGVVSVTVMEVLRGARNKREMDRIGRHLASAEVLHLLKQDSEWAVRQFRAFWLSHHIGMADCLIAAVAARTRLPLYTLNTKDFEPLPALEIIKPY